MSFEAKATKSNNDLIFQTQLKEVSINSAKNVDLKYLLPIYPNGKRTDCTKVLGLEETEEKVLYDFKAINAQISGNSEKVSDCVSAKKFMDQKYIIDSLLLSQKQTQESTIKNPQLLKELSIFNQAIAYAEGPVFHRGVVELAVGCTGFMIGPRLIVTSAHCIDCNPPDKWWSS